MPNLRKANVTVFDEKTWARLERERKLTIKVLLAAKTREQRCRKEVFQAKQEGKHDDEKTSLVMDGRKVKEPQEEQREIAIKNLEDRYRYTKLSKVKRLRLRRQAEARGKYLKEYERRKFVASLTGLKQNLLNQKQEYFCHINERRIEKEKNEERKIASIRRKYEIGLQFPASSVVFKKILEHKRRRRQQRIAREERMTRIIEKISRELNCDNRISKKMKTLDVKKELNVVLPVTNTLQQGDEKSYDEKKIVDDVKIENIQGDQEGEQEQRKDELLVESYSPIEKAEEYILSDDKYNFDAVIERISRVQTRDLPKDTCFYANPNIIIFNDFKINKSYNRKVTITNKTPKWSYIRYNRIVTEIWEPNVFTIETIDAARVRPGLHLTINVTFSPVNDETITADICFVTLHPDDPTTLHEFCIPIRCTPERPLPVLDPKEVRFHGGPIWKCSSSKLQDRVLTVSNEGGKSFSFIIDKKDPNKDCFIWEFDEVKPESVHSSHTKLNIEEVEEDKITNETFVQREKYQIEVPPKFKCSLRITFRARYVGLHHEVMEILFLEEGQIFDKQNVALWAEVTGPQIHLDPPCVDLGIVMIDSGVSQQNFDIVNTGRTPMEVLMKTPKRLGTQVSVHPKSALVQPESSCTVSVRLIPESNITIISKSYYDTVSSILEFPIHVQELWSETEKPPPLILKVLASLTTCHALLLEPPCVDLGCVFTHESVFTELKLTNESLVMQDYGFLNLPSFMEIQPDDGFGSILPGETVTLRLIYSACLTDIPGNELGTNGLAGGRRFEIQAVTLAELAGNKNQINIGEIRNSYDVQSKVPCNSDFSSVFDESEAENTTNDTDEKFVTRSSDFTENSHSSVDDKELENTNSTSNNIVSSDPEKDQRNKKNVIEVVVHIKDTFCELSEQILEFPATPCGSYSVVYEISIVTSRRAGSAFHVSVELRGFNMASQPRCSCGIVKNQAQEFTARYEFKCSSRRVEVVPQNGLLHSNDLLKVSFIFRPRLSKRAVLERARELRDKRTADEKERTDRLRGEEKSALGKKERKKKSPGRKVVVPEKERKDEEKVSDDDKLSGEVSLLENFEPTVATIFVTCTIQAEMKDGTKRDEVLFAKLMCPIVRPEIVILNTRSGIAFERMAIGTVERQFILVKNISNRNVKVNVSTLDPFGPFFVAPGKLIETGSILKLPITYRPTEDHQDHIQEFFQVSGRGTRTIWRLGVSGTGIVPSWNIIPQTRIARLVSTSGRPVELKISEARHLLYSDASVAFHGRRYRLLRFYRGHFSAQIQNTGMCRLTFQLRAVDMLEGNMPRMQEEEEPPERTRKRDKKGETQGGENKGKTRRKEKFNDDLYEDEELAIFGGKLVSLVDRGYFSFKNLDESMRITVAEKEKVEFGIRFHPSRETISKEKKTGSKKSGKGSSRVDAASSKTHKSNYYYVGIFELTLGSATFVRDIILICSVE